MTNPTDQAGDQHQANWYVLLYGIAPPTSPMVVAQGLAIRPLAEPLSVFDLAAAGAAGFREWALLEPIANGCACEIESALDAAETPGYDTLNRAWLATALLVLRGHTHVLPVACCTYSWKCIAGHSRRAPPLDVETLLKSGVDAAIRDPARQLPTFTGQILDFHRRVFVGSTPRNDALSEEDVQWMRSHYETFNRLAAESESFRLALEASIDWRFANDPRASVARLWTGIEAVFGLSSELVYRISLLCAGLLEPRGPARRMRFAAVKSLYGLRSKIVHGDTIPQDNIARAMSESFALLRDLLVLSIERGRALGKEDFDAAVFD